MENAKKQIHFAPLQGYADNAYRRLHTRIYGGIEAYYTPFIRIEKGEPRRVDMQRLAACKDDGTNTIPQIIFGSVDEFVMLRDAVKMTGCTQIDLNLGCPFPMQTKRGRGAAMISDIEQMRNIATLIDSDKECSYSVKMRLGLHEANEWMPLLEILNDLHLAHITIHPRTARQMYDGELDMAQFDEFAKRSANPVIYNGGIHTLQNIDEMVQRDIAPHALMIGRGLLARPSLAIEYRTSTEWSTEQRMSKLHQFHNMLLDEYEGVLCGETQILQKIKPFWEYLEPEIGHKAYKAIKKATTLAKYRMAVESLV